MKKSEDPTYPRSVRMKNSLWEKVKEQAVKQGLTPNAFIVECLQKAVEGQKDVSDKDRLGGYPA